MDAYRTVSADGPFGEDALKMVIMSHFGSTLSSLAMKGSVFPKGSIADKYTLRVQACGDIAEFELEEMELLENPIVYLDKRFVKASDTVKPDGLKSVRLFRR
jgi:hypothetical protein